MNPSTRQQHLLSIVSHRLAELSQPPVTGEKAELVRELSQHMGYSKLEVAQAICMIDSQHAGAYISIDHSTSHQLVICYQQHRIVFSPTDIIRLVPELTAVAE